MDRKELIDYLGGCSDVLREVEILSPGGHKSPRGSKKLEEVAGFCAVILRYVSQFAPKRDPIEILECSCGKSYLGFVLLLLLRELEARSARLVGVDSNRVLIDKCRAVADTLELGGAEFVATRTVRYEADRHFDLVVSLHACDTATDETIAKGIKLEAELILTVPCCQNQIRGQIRSGHPLTVMTQFGPVRYRLANMLTDCLRAQFLRSAGYHVEMDEITSPRLTPKNLCICARRLRHPGGKPRDAEYRMLRDFFNVRPKIEALCPGVIGNEPCAEAS